MNRRVNGKVGGIYLIRASRIGSSARKLAMISVKDTANTNLPEALVPWDVKGRSLDCLCYLNNVSQSIIPLAIHIPTTIQSNLSAINELLSEPVRWHA